jgi:quercetin dioxygenase-like cupin family protein
VARRSNDFKEKVMKNTTVSNSKTISRRKAILALSASAAGAMLTSGANAQEAKAAAGAPPVLNKTGVWPLADMPTTKSANGATVHHTFIASLTTGEIVDVHQTTLAAGDMPHPEKIHPETMIVMLRDGELEFLMEGKIVRKMVPGDVAYSVPGQLHGLRNVGKTTANYFVIAIGHGNGKE